MQEETFRLIREKESLSEELQGARRRMEEADRTHHAERAFLQSQVEVSPPVSPPLVLVTHSRETPWSWHHRLSRLVRSEQCGQQGLRERRTS